jgi:GNAT superfamily N-acetyltransferase
MISDINIRIAVPDDVSVILRFIKALADYEKLLPEVVATEDMLREWIFEKRGAEAIICEVGGEPVGFALFFTNFSTFLGRSGLYLEDLFVLPEMRGRGIGKAMLAHLAKLAKDRGYGRFEWWCLDWNEPSIKFYRSLGAVPMDEWTVYRLTGGELEALASQAAP